MYIFIVLRIYLLFTNPVKRPNPASVLLTILWFIWSQCHIRRTCPAAEILIRAEIV